MGIETNFTCNCCGALYVNNAPNWFILSQPEKNNDKDVAKLENDLCFCKLRCLFEWTQKAVKAEKEMQDNTIGLSPRGKITSIRKDMQDLYL